MKRKSQRGLTLVELVVTFTIMLILSVMAIPLARVKIRTQREVDLKYALREMYTAIDKYKDACSQGVFGATKQGTFCYPESLEILVEGVKTLGADGKKLKFLRSVPRDPFTNGTDWGLRSMQDDSKAQTWGGQNVFNVYSKTLDRDKDGRPYSEW
jgi:general secretion pathway protein G